MTTALRDPRTVNHQGYLLTFAAGVGTDHETLYYDVLAAGPQDDPEQRREWAGFKPLTVPTHLTPVGMSLITVEEAPTTTGTIADAPFAVVSDQRYVYVFRGSSQGTLYVNRLQLVVLPGDDETTTSEVSVRPAWDVRYRHSGKRDLGDGPLDTVGYLDMDGAPYLDPTWELSMVRGADSGQFAVTMVPTHIDGVARWQLFVVRGDGVDCFSFLRGTTGLFDLSDQRLDAATGALGPEKRFTFTRRDDSTTIDQAVASGPAALLYAKQEGTSAGGKVKRNGRVLLTLPLRDATLGITSPGSVAALDFGVSDAGRLALGVLPDIVELGPLGAASQALRFGAEGWVGLAKGPQPLTLDATFTQEAWIIPDAADLDADTLFGYNQKPPTGKQPPSLWVENKRAIAVGFGDGTTDLKASTAEVLVPGRWSHVAATFDGTRYRIYVNGGEVALAPSSHDFSGKAPANGKVTAIGRGAGPFDGAIDEIRIWTAVRTAAEIQAAMYRELTSAELQDPALAGCWTLDGDLTDSSGHGHDLVLHGPKWIPSDSPVKRGEAGDLFVNDDGLTVTTGLLDFAETDSTPALLDGSDGLVHLYFSGAGDEFDVARFDAAVSRATLALQWRAALANDPSTMVQTGEVSLVSRMAGPTMNGASASVSTSLGVSQFCSVTLSEGTAPGAVTETWSGVPDRLDAFLDVLAGRATADPGDPLVAVGRRTFFDYYGASPASRLLVGTGDTTGAVVIVTARPREALLARVATAADINDSSRCTVTVKFTVNGWSLTETWPGVPTDAARMAATLSGGATDYVYSRVADDGQVASLAAGASTVHCLADPAVVSGLAVTISAPSSGDPAYCWVGVIATRQGAPDLDASWDEVPREQTALTDVINGRDGTYQKSRFARGDYLALRSVLTLTTDGLTATVSDQQASSSTGFVAARVLMQAFSDNAVGPVAPQAVSAVIMQSASSSDLRVNLAGGSRLFAATVDTTPSNGRVPRVLAGTAVMKVPGVAGGWVPASPSYAVAFAEGDDAAADLTRPSAQALDLRSSFTAETWLRPTPGRSSQVFSANFESVPPRADDGRFLLGIDPTGALQLLGGTVKIDSADAMAGPDGSTVELWLNPDVTKIPAGEFRTVFRRANPALGEERLQIADNGTLVYTMAISGSSVPVSSTRALESGAWSHVAVTRHDTSAHIYLGGVLVAELSTAPALIQLPSFVLGDDNPAGPLEQMFNQARAWSRALTGVEVARLPRTSVPTDAKGLTLLWRLDVDNGTTIVNEAAATKGRLDGTLDGQRLWSGTAGVFCGVHAAAQDVAVQSPGGILTSGDWAHLALAYDSGCCLQLDGTQWADCGKDDGLNAADVLSLECWVTLESSSSDLAQILVSKFGDTVETQSYQLMVNGEDHLVAQVMSENGTILEAVSDGPLVVGSPTYVAAAFKAVTVASESTTNPGTVKYVCTWTLQIYVDGEPAAVVAEMKFKKSPEGIAATTTPVLLGRSAAAAGDSTPAIPGYGLIGELADVRIWRATLSKEQIKATHADRGRPGALDGLVSWWRFDEQEGRLAADARGQNAARLSSRDLWGRYSATSRLTLLADGAVVGNLVDKTPADLGGYGAKHFSAGEDLRAEVDELRLWTVARTRGEIAGNMYRALGGNELDLAGYWPCDVGSGGRIVDATGRGNDLVFTTQAGSAPPTWVASLAPVGDEAPMVRDVIGGVVTALTGTVTGTPTVAEYATTTTDVEGRLRSAMERAYVSARGTEVESSLGFVCGELEQSYIGQVQSKPTVLGFIEGPPPVPSENLVPSAATLGAAEYADYADRAKVALTEADTSERVFSSSRDSGFDLSADMKAQWWFVTNVDVGGPFVLTTGVQAETRVGLHTEIEFETSKTSESKASSKLTTTLGNAMSLQGSWEPANDVLNPAVGRRFVPANTGYALVRSFTANLYAVRLKSTGALVSLVTVPNADIPEDINLLPFPIQPDYTKNGTLDGLVGFVPDSSFPEAVVGPTSYFKPIEAYNLKQRIQRERVEIEAYFAQFEAAKEGTGPEGSIDDVISGNPFYDWAKRISKKSLVNSYVWTASGGFFKEEEEFAVLREESMGGSYSFTQKAGLAVEGTGAFGGFGFAAALDFLVGGHLKVTAVQTSIDGDDFGLTAEVSPDRYLTDASGTLIPGKVDGYRFMTFYLAPSKDNGTTLFEQVIDQAWLRNSQEAAAIALNQAQPDGNGVWRVLHRVTYVSRVPPVFQPTPTETMAPTIREPVNLSGNWQLVTMVADALGTTVDPTPVQIGDAVRQAVEQTLPGVLPWWAAYLAAAKVVESAEWQALGALELDLQAYLVAHYAARAALQSSGAATAIRRRPM